jgi:hypothetical protein
VARSRLFPIAAFACLIAAFPPLHARAAGAPGIEAAPRESTPPDSAGASALDSTPPDSAGLLPSGEAAWPDSMGPLFGPGDWDSVVTAYDRAMRRENRRTITPEYGLRYSKAEGVHLEAGASFAYRPWRLSHLEGRFGYDLKRERPTGAGRLRFALFREGRLHLDLQAHSGAVPFGNHDPYGNTVLTLLGGYDARQYMLERELSGMLEWRPDEEERFAAGWVRTEQDPLRPVEDWHLFGPERWMEENEAAEPILLHGIRLRFDRRPTYLDATGSTGLTAGAVATAYGGRLLGSRREFSLIQGDLWYTRMIHAEDAWHVRASGSIAPGRPPLQAWPDLGGAGGLKAFPPRGFGTRDRLVGLSRWVVRLEYQREQEILRRTRLPVIKRFSVKLLPFVEAGSVWGRRPILRWKDLRLPRASEYRWDLGFGLRHEVGYSGILSHAQLDFAWPMGAQTGPVRITVQLSSNGLD